MAAKSQKMYIDGKWVDASSGQTFEDLNPYTGEAYAHVPAGTAEDARSAIDAAKAAFPEWAATPPAAKRQIFLKAADVMESRQDELVQAMMEEVGGTIGIAMFQMCFVPGLLRMAAAGAAYDVKGEIIPADHANSFFMAMRQPAGVVACFAPFNVPVHPGQQVVHHPHCLRQHRSVEAVRGCPGHWRASFSPRYSRRQGSRRACSMSSPGPGRQPRRSVTR